MLHTHRACSACPRHATQNALAGRTDISWLRICAELQVGWNWGGSHAEGHVEDVIPHDATIESKGKEIKRKGTEENPAVVVSNDKPGGNPVIKKASELHTFKEVRALYDTVLCLRAELPQAVHVRQHLIKHCQFWRCVQICEVPVARP